VNLPASFHPVQRLRLDRLTLIRYVSKRPQDIWFHTLRDLPTGFGSDAVVIDGLPEQALLPARAGLGAGALASVRSDGLR
jgi:hypothetical protein